MHHMTEEMLIAVYPSPEHMEQELKLSWEAHWKIFTLFLSWEFSPKLGVS
jgi:hypothetical protein